MSLMLSQSPVTHASPAQHSRRLSVGAAAKTRTCVHCGRSFRRTEHLERHVRTHTKEKPYTCLCGAAFSRRDLLKRHMGITGHEDVNPPNKSTSPKSQHRTDHDTKQRIRRASTATVRSRRESVPNAASQDPSSMPPSPVDAEPVHWTMHQNTSYMKDENGYPDPASDGTHDPEILEAAQLLLPGGATHGIPNYTPTTTSSYLPEEPHHYEDFTNFFEDMRLFATSRALRLGSGRWSITSARSSIRLPLSQLLRAGSVGHREWSSTVIRRTQHTINKSESTATTPSASPKSLTVGGKAYPIDDWTNTPDTILAHIDRRLYLDDSHPLAITRKLIESQFPRPVYGNYSEKDPIVTTAQNFDVLGFPADHPGRSRTDTYYLNEKTVLRTHTSAHQQAYFQQISRNEETRPEEVGYTVVADVYRRDAIDRSHYPVFHQMEGAMLWKRPADKPLEHAKQTAAAIMKDVYSIPSHSVPVEDPNPTIHPQRNPLQADYHSEEEVEAIAAHLKRSLERMVIKVFSEAQKASAASEGAEAETLRVRWVEAYFPFTSPSWELEVFWQGDWLEILGCGVVKQELLNNSDVPNRVGWAFGLGLERIAMLLFNIPDIRLFWSKDERFLSQFKAGQITRFEPFSKYPACYKDVAFWLPSAATSGGSAAGGAVPVHENDIMEIVRGVGGNLVEDVKLIDEFIHPKTNRKSLCYRINYRSLERTLTNEETNDLHDKVRQKLVSQLCVELR